MSTEPNCLLKKRDVLKLLGNCSSMHIWRLLHDERYRHYQFPRPLELGVRPVWRESDVLKWIVALPQKKKQNKEAA